LGHGRRSAFRSRVRATEPGRAARQLEEAGALSDWNARTRRNFAQPTGNAASRPRPATPAPRPGSPSGTSTEPRYLKASPSATPGAGPGPEAGSEPGEEVPPPVGPLGRCRTGRGTAARPPGLSRRRPPVYRPGHPSRVSKASQTAADQRGHYRTGAPRSRGPLPLQRVQLPHGLGPGGRSLPGLSWGIQALAGGGGEQQPVRAAHPEERPAAALRRRAHSADHHRATHRAGGGLQGDRRRVRPSTCWLARPLWKWGSMSAPWRRW
jgi:hypothetical protein